MIRPFSELFARIRNWRVRPAATPEPRNGGIPAHLQAPSWLPRRRSGGDGWTRVSSPSELAAFAGLSTRPADGFAEQVEQQRNDRANRTARFVEEGERI